MSDGGENYSGLQQPAGGYATPGASGGYGPSQNPAPAQQAQRTTRQHWVTVILDLPAESGDKFQLVGDDGSYTKILGASDAEALVEGEKILRFKIKPDEKGYKLIHHRSKGAKRTIFLKTRIQDMTEAGNGPETAEYSYARIDSQVPKKLPDRYGTVRDVDKDLVQASPVLVDLQVEDPEL